MNESISYPISFKDEFKGEDGYMCRLNFENLKS